MFNKQFYVWTFFGVLKSFRKCEKLAPCAGERHLAISLMHQRNEHQTAERKRNAFSVLELNQQF